VFLIKQITHLNVNKKLSGEPIELKEGYSKVKLQTNSDMVTDSSGLIHGGFTFSLADYAAMLAINHPNVVLGAASSRFLLPVIEGDVLIAEAQLVRKEGKKLIVDVSVKRKEQDIFTGEFICFTPEKYILGGD